MKSEHKKLAAWLAAALAALVGVAAWQWLRPASDNGSLVFGNGRIEATEVDVAAKAAGRVQ